MADVSEILRRQVERKQRAALVGEITDRLLSVEWPILTGDHRISAEQDVDLLLEHLEAMTAERDELAALLLSKR